MWFHLTAYTMELLLVNLTYKMSSYMKWYEDHNVAQMFFFLLFLFQINWRMNCVQQKWLDEEKNAYSSSIKSFSSRLIITYSLEIWLYGLHNHRLQSYNLQQYSKCQRSINKSDQINIFATPISSKPYWVIIISSSSSVSVL